MNIAKNNISTMLNCSLGAMIFNKDIPATNMNKEVAKAKSLFNFRKNLIFSGSIKSACLDLRKTSYI
jgi:hypothetical protein